MEYLLKLYVTARTPNSIRALDNLRRICEESLDDEQYEIRVIDVQKDPDLAEGDKVVATPTLIRNLPVPIRRIIGDLSDRDRVLFGLELVRKGETKENA